MTREYSPDGDDSGDQRDEYSVQFETIEAKAREALKHDDPEQSCDVNVLAHNRVYDSKRDVTTHLINTWEEWIAVRTWSEASGETGLRVTDNGKNLITDPLELDRNRVAVYICREAINLIDDRSEDERSVEPFTTLVQFAGGVTDGLVGRWQERADSSVKREVEAGNAEWVGSTAWTTDEDAVSVPADKVTTILTDEYTECDVSNDAAGTIRNICEQALLIAVTDHCDCRSKEPSYAAKIALRG